MTAPINVGLGFRVANDSQEAIRALDPRIELVDLSALGSPKPIDDAGRQALLERIAGVEVMVGANSIPAEYFAAAANLRWFQVINAGVEELHANGTLARGFQVTTGAGIAAGPIAEHGIGLMLMLARSLHTSVRNMREQTWERGFTSQLAGKTLGIVGLGEIGRAVARRARPFDMRIIATRRNPGDGRDPDCDEVYAHTDLGELLARSDYLFIAAPLTPETRHMLSAAEFAQMKPTAFVINVGRGEVIDQQALVRALESGQIAGAALDVTDPEPLPPGHALWSMPNVIITPHVAGAVEGYGHRAIRVFVANLQRYLAGEPLSHVVDPVLGY
jgi:phosphoglycerate dehydrogenase-like enzyme